MPRIVEYQRPKLYAKQEAAIFTEKRYAIIEASTKSGKTFGCMAWLLEQALKGQPGQNFWWVAPVFTQASMVFDLYKQSFRAQDLPQPEVWNANEGKLCIDIGNKTRIWHKSADNPDSLYGADVWAAVLDEATRCKEEAWHALRSTLTATRGPIRMIGNVKGRRNFAFRLARLAESGAPDMHYAKMTAYDAVEAGVLDAQEIESAKRTLPEAVFRELYLAEPSDDEGNPFGAQHIRACIAPMHDECSPTVWGWDLARKVDWVVGIGLCVHGSVSRLERWQHLPWEETHKRIKRFTEDVPALIDSTGVGDPAVERLSAEGRNYLGFQFTSRSKQQLMEGLAVAIQHHEVSFPEGVLTQELLAFEYVVTRTAVQYSAPEGLHDDCVVALALAVRHKGAANVEFRVVNSAREFAGVISSPDDEAREKHEAAASELLSRVRTQGTYWPGGR